MTETEKITINLGAVDLGKIDLLVENSFYSNRTDFIRTAIRNLLVSHEPTIQQTILRDSFVVGIIRFTKAELEQAVAAGTQYRVRSIGVLVIENDVTPELALASIASINLKGILKASPALSAALEGRITR
jgi:Arc/MetJ-type ribon-helix-helix transcriptional regulator